MEENKQGRRHHQNCQQNSRHHRSQQQQSHFDYVDVSSSSTVRKKCPNTSCYERNTGSSSVAVSTTSDSDIRRTGGAVASKATPNKALIETEGITISSVGPAEQAKEGIVLRRSVSQINEHAYSAAAPQVQSRPSSVKLRSQSTSSSGLAAASSVDADPFAYQDSYPYWCNQKADNCSKRMSASNSRRSSRIKLPSTRAESRDEGNYFYPADSLKLYGHVGHDLDDESDSGASSLPSSNGSTLNSSCASIDLVRCKTAFDASSTSPQHRRISLSDEQQQQQQPTHGISGQPHQAPPQHPNQQCQHLVEFSKFKNDSGTFTDSDLSPEFRGFTPDKDLTPTKQQQQQQGAVASCLPGDVHYEDDYRLEDDSPAAVADASINSRSTLNSIVTVIERRYAGSASGCEQQQQRQSLRHHRDDGDDDQLLLLPPDARMSQRDSSDRSSSSTLDGEDLSPRDEGEGEDGNGAAEGASATGGDDSSSEASDLTSVSATFSLMQSDLKYEFNTWDKPTIRTFGLRVREISRPPSEAVIAGWGDAELLARVRQLGRLRGSCVRLHQATRQFSGRVRVHVNLIRPIRLGRAELPQLVPRGQSRLLQLSSSVCSLDVIQALLGALQVKEQPYKFALYEHSIDGDKSVTFRKLHPTESPLALVLSWLHETPLDDPEQCRPIFERKKVVLQENESGLVNWSAFSVPELSNFLQILQREESEYRESIQLKYLLMKREMRRRIRQLEKQKQMVEEDWP